MNTLSNDPNPYIQNLPLPDRHCNQVRWPEVYGRGIMGYPVQAVSQALSEKKLTDISVLDMRDHSYFCDYIIIATGTSSRQLRSTSDVLCQMFKAEGYQPTVEGLPYCDWILIYVGDLVVHLFKPEARAFYNIEKMWFIENGGERIFV